MKVTPMEMFVMMPAGWLNRFQQNVVEYLKEENTVLGNAWHHRTFHIHSPAGGHLIASRRTGSALVYASLVSCGLECSSRFWVTAVDTPR